MCFKFFCFRAKWGFFPPPFMAISPPLQSLYAACIIIQQPHPCYCLSILIIFHSNPRILEYAHSWPRTLVRPRKKNPQRNPSQLYPIYNLIQNYQNVDFFLYSTHFNIFVLNNVECLIGSNMFGHILRVQHSF